MADYQEGQTATAKDGKSRVVYTKGMWVKDSSFKPAPVAQKAKTTAQDQKALQEASARAQAERDAARDYGEAERAIRDMGTGPARARYLDAITPDEDGGILDNIGAILGTPLRALESPKALQGRDHLRTVNARVALAGSQQMKGSSSDKDTALMRMSGIGPYKSTGENLRIIKEAKRNSGMEVMRSKLKAYWIGKYGSLSNPSGNGSTFEDALLVGEKSYNDRVAGLPKSPPSRRKAKAPSTGGAVTIDMNGNPL